jgi:predicted nucleic acid-binding Zn ribbon protein
MKRSNTEPISKVIRQYLKELQIEKKLKEVSLAGEWEEIVGKIIASKTEKITIRNGTMFIHIRSSVVKNELMMIREELMQALNARAGEELVKEIVFR